MQDPRTTRIAASSERGRGRSIALAVLLAIVAGAGCKTPASLIDEGDRFRSAKQYDEALARYREARDLKDTDAPQKEKIDRAAGEILLEKGDLDGAEASLKKLPESSSVRSALLAQVSFGRKDRARAEALYRDAYVHGERGIVVSRLAELVGAEAETPDRLLEAAKILRDGGGDDKLAKALDDAALVWRARDRGEPPASLLPKLPERQAAPAYPIVAFLRADLLEKAGELAKAEQAYVDLAQTEPRPTAEFLKRASEKRAAMALASGDQDVLERALASGTLTKERAALVRADLARAREASGDLLEALSLYKKTAAAGGASAARAFCEIARIEDGRGRSQAADDAWKSAASAEKDGAARALLAIHLARAGDPLAARGELEDVARSGSLEPEIRDEAARAQRACLRIEAATKALARREADLAASFARSALAIEPSWPSAQAVLVAADAFAKGADEKEAALSGAKALDSGNASGKTLAAFVRAKVALLLDAALCEEATKAGDPLAAQAATDAIVELAPSALARLLRGGRTDAAVSLFLALKARKSLEAAKPLVDRARGDATFAAMFLAPKLVDAIGRADALARSAPYCCELSLKDGEALGVVRVTDVSSAGMSVLVPGRPVPVRIPAERLTPASARGVPDEVFTRACEAARSLPSGEELK